MINFFNLVNAMRQETKPDARIHGIITDGGKAANIIPDYTAASFYIRANRVADVKKLAERVRNCAAGAALGTGCTYKMEYNEENFKDTVRNHVLNDLAAAISGVCAPPIGFGYSPILNCIWIAGAS